jgi:hypothetical protein
MGSHVSTPTPSHPIQLCNVSIPLPGGYRFPKATLELPLFGELPLSSVTWCHSLSDMEIACKALFLYLLVMINMMVKWYWDLIPSQPIFRSGVKSDGPHLIQLST